MLLKLKIDNSLSVCLSVCVCFIRSAVLIDRTKTRIDSERASKSKCDDHDFERIIRRKTLLPRNLRDTARELA